MFFRRDNHRRLANNTDAILTAHWLANQIVRKIIENIEIGRFEHRGYWDGVLMLDNDGMGNALGQILKILNHSRKSKK